MKPSVKRYIENSARLKRYREDIEQQRQFRDWYLSVAKNEWHMPNK